VVTEPGRSDFGTAERGHVLGVDLGTSNTVAVMRWPDGRTRALLFDGQPLLPSAVHLDPSGRMHVGRDAVRMAQADPSRHEPNPKSRIDERTVLLGDAEVEVVDLLAAILREVARAAVEAVGYLPPAVLTHPAAWGGHRRQLLGEAVRRAGWPPVRLLPEPVAAAHYFADVLRRPVPIGSALGVFDFGGGTLDVAVLRNDGGRFSVLGSGGLEDLGGVDLDGVLVDHLGGVVSRTSPEVTQRLQAPHSQDDRRARRLFWQDVRGAKEMLSRTAAAPVPVPGLEQTLHLTRDELEGIAGPLLRRAVDETAAVIRKCGLEPSELTSLFLVGGSSRVPMVARMLHSQLGIAPTVLEQPELPVAEGALAVFGPPAEPTSAVPSSPGIPVGAAAAAGTVAGTAAGAAMGAATVPGSGPPGPPGPPTGTAVVPGSPAAPGYPPPGSPAAAYGAPPPPPPQRGWRALLRRRSTWIAGGAAALVLVLLGWAALTVLSPYSQVDFLDELEPVGKPLAMADGSQIPSGDGAYAAVVEDHAYFASQKDNKLEVVAASTETGKELWRNDAYAESETWEGIEAREPAVVVRAKDTAASPPTYTLYGLDPDDGDKMWDFPTSADGGSVIVFDEYMLVEDDQGQRLRKIRLTDGKQVWSTDLPSGSTVGRVYSRSDYRFQGSFGGLFDEPDPRVVEIRPDRSVKVIDTEAEKVLKSKGNVADTDDKFLAFDDTLYVATGDTGYRLDAYDLDSMGKPDVWYQPTGEDRSVADLEPCDTDRMCILESAGVGTTQTEVIAVDGDGKVWSAKVDDASELLGVGDHVMVSASSGTVVLDPDGKTEKDGAGRGIPITAGSMLLLSGGGSSVSRVSVTGLNLRSDDEVQLGALRILSDRCAWDETLLACPTETGDDAKPGFGIWRFAD
jgi:molecular chaperone HscA